MMWMLLLSPIIFVLMGSALIGVGVWLKRGGSPSARFVFPAGAGAYVGGITCLLAWAVDEEAGRMLFVTAFFALTLAWVAGCLVLAALEKGRMPRHPAPLTHPPQAASTR